MGFVVGLSGLQAVVELSEEFVEQVPFGFLEPVAFGSACLVVSPRFGRGFQRCHRPDRTCGGEATVFDARVRDDGFLAAGAVDRCGSREGFQSAGVVEFGSVVTNLGEYPDADHWPHAGEAGQDFRVRVS